MNTNYNFLEQFGKSFIESNDIAQHFYISFDDRRSKWYEGINEYPAIYAVVRSVVLGQQVINWTVDFYFLDLLLDDKSNENSVMNNTLELANQFQNFVYQNKGNGFETDGRPIAQPLNNFDNNKMNGWRVGFNFETPREQCFGSEGFEPTQLCADATYRVEYEDGTLIEEGTIPSGGSVTVQVPDPTTCPVANWVLEDANGNVLDSGTIESGDSATITAPSASVTVLNSLGTTVDSGTVLSGGSGVFNAPDSPIQVNGEAEGNLPSGATLNVTTNITPDSVDLVGGNLNLEFPPCPQDYKIQVIYNEGDDEAEFTVVTDKTITITSINTTLTINNVEVNEVAVNVPFVLEDDDKVFIEFDSAPSKDEIELIGTYE